MFDYFVVGGKMWYNCTIICDLLFLRLFKRFFKIRVRGGFRVRVSVGNSFRLRVRDRVSFRAEGWVGFMYYGPKLFEIQKCWSLHLSVSL